MSKSIREVPKEIATFGEKQFKETGAMAVEVLRVKASVMRKHFRQLKGIAFLVSVISLDRVRIYFFNSVGMMLVGENVEVSMYNKIRATSKLIAKYEKPRELTPEELRIEATQELRDSLAKALRKVARVLNSTPPIFPDIFVTRTSSDEFKQSFGLQISDSGEYLFEESALKAKWTEGLIIRTAFLTHLDSEKSKSQIASLVGNAIALALLKEPERKAFHEIWSKFSKNTEWLSIVNHMIKHVDCYTSAGFTRLYSLIQQTPSLHSQKYDWKSAIRIIHDSVNVTIGTEEYHIIRRFCQNLSKPRKIDLKRDHFESIHLAPRVICDPTPLDLQISLFFEKPTKADWATVSFIEGSKVNSLSIRPGNGLPVSAIEYWLNFEDVYPSSGGLVSHGKNILHRALAILGVRTEFAGTFESSILFSDSPLMANEKAVLDRLILGQTDVITNTMIGSPQVVDSLFAKGKIIFLPSFNHIGMESDFILRGSADVVQSVVKQNSIESTVFRTSTDSVAIVSAPATWRSALLDSAAKENISIWPVHSITSERNILRSEALFPDDGFTISAQMFT